ncbi:MAG: rRNA maturation RNase YbeY [Calditrichaeota bacterium]|nr:MAG: rRNA maturation RNase YbeY [Calditrichota bacterium]
MKQKPRIQISLHEVDLRLKQKPLKAFVQAVLQQEQIPASHVHIILVNDEYLRQLHARFLNDDTYTDVMTFNLGDQEDIEGEIYISLDRAGKHAQRFGVTLAEEILRLIAHGLLHLKGLDDETEAQRKVMRQKEDQILKTLAPTEAFLE